MFTKLSIRIYIFLLFIASSLVCRGVLILASDFQKLKKGHFIIYHNNRSFANKLSWKAEYHYKRIVNHFGVTGFRPWEDKDKCPIYIYESKGSFMEATGAPEWSEGETLYEPFMFSSHEDAPNLFSRTLPHEMTHMLLYLFMDKKPPPLWLDEGMAQFEEEERTVVYNRKRFIKLQVKEGIYIGLNELMSMTSVPEDRVELFYAEAASIVEHLINDNIRANYGRFLMHLKNGETAEDALKKAYQRKYKNGFSDLEKRWLEFIKRKY